MNQLSNSVKLAGKVPETHVGGTAPGCWCVLLFVLAFFLSFASFASSHDLCYSWEEFASLRRFNFFVIAPLWAAGAILRFKGKTRCVLAILAFIVPATMLTMMQEAVTAARIAEQPRHLTSYAMMDTLQRIQKYMKLHRQVPPNLAAVPEEEDRHKAIDGWGHALQYSVDSDGVITLTSYGADGKPGGDGRDADIIRRYRTRNTDGTLNIDDFDWINSSRIQ